MQSENKKNTVYIVYKNTGECRSFSLVFLSFSRQFLSAHPSQSRDRCILLGDELWKALKGNIFKKGLEEGNEGGLACEELWWSISVRSIND